MELTFIKGNRRGTQFLEFKEGKTLELTFSELKELTQYFREHDNYTVWLIHSLREEIKRLQNLMDNERPPVTHDFVRGVK